MIVWSPSSWALYKQCPAKYRIKKVERWHHPSRKPDRSLMRLAVPGLVVDRLLQFWIYRGEFADADWMTRNFDMVWNMIDQKNHPKWFSQDEQAKIYSETVEGLNNAVKLLTEFDLVEFELFPQLWFFEKITPEYAITGGADLVMKNKQTGKSLLIDFKNAHYRNKVTKDQLIIYQIGIERTTDIEIEKSAYLLFNPRVKQWKWFSDSPRHRELLLEKLAAATKQVIRKNFPYKWSHYGCTQFCEARFGCQIFQKLIGKTQKEEISK